MMDNYNLSRHIYQMVLTDAKEGYLSPWETEEKIERLIDKANQEAIEEQQAEIVTLKSRIQTLYNRRKKVKHTTPVKTVTVQLQLI